MTLIGDNKRKSGKSRAKAPRGGENVSRDSSTHCTDAIQAKPLEVKVYGNNFEKAVKASPDTNNKKSTANLVGKLVAERALGKGVKQIVFDRNGFLYHGRVKAVSDGARETGLDF